MESRSTTTTEDYLPPVEVEPGLKKRYVALSMDLESYVTNVIPGSISSSHKAS
jgi:hypothetical protein